VVQVLPGTKDVFVRTEFSEKLLCRSTGSDVTTPGQKVYASIRPEDVGVFAERPQTGDNIFKGIIANKAYLGNFLFLFVNINGTTMRVQAPHQLPQEEGHEIYLYLNPGKCIVLPE